MKFDLLTINGILFYWKDKNAHKCCTIVFNILFDAHPSKLKNN